MKQENSTPSIDYVEVGLCEKKIESVGLLSSYNFLQDGIYIIPRREGEGAYFNLRYFSLTFIKVGYEEKFEEYFFKDKEDDQDEAKQVLISIISTLKTEKRCTNNEFIKTDTFTRLPEEYLKSKLGSKCKTSTVYGAPQGSNTVKTVGHNNNIVPTTIYPQQNKIVFIKRKSPLPKKAALKALADRIAKGNIEVTLPFIVDLEPDTKTTKHPNVVYDSSDEDSYANMYGGY